MIQRYYQKLDSYLEKNKVLVIYGPRQVGKTTLLNSFLSQTKLKYKIDSGDNIRTQEILSSQDFTRILDYVSGYELLAIDEAQRIPHVGMGLKIIVDQVPGLLDDFDNLTVCSHCNGEVLDNRFRIVFLFDCDDARGALLLKDSNDLPQIRGHVKDITEEEEEGPEPEKEK